MLRPTLEFNPAPDEHADMPGVLGVFISGWCVFGVMMFHPAWFPDAPAFRFQAGVIVFNIFVGVWDDPE